MHPAAISVISHQTADLHLAMFSRNFYLHLSDLTIEVNANLHPNAIFRSPTEKIRSPTEKIGAANWLSDSVRRLYVYIALIFSESASGQRYID